MKSRCKCGLVIHSKGLPARSLPLKRVELSIESRCVLASVEAVLVYENDESSPVEVEFVMPLEGSAVVTGLSARLDGRTVRGEVKGKEEAKDDYDDAISSGGTAVFGEHQGKDMFRLLLGNLSVGGKAELRLSVLLEMSREEGIEIEEGAALRFSLPTTLKPRYIPISSAVPGATQTSSCDASAEYELSVAMRLGYAGGLSRVESPSHKISTGVLEGGVWQVQLIDPKPLEKDLCILLYPTQPAVPAILYGAPREPPAPLDTTTTADKQPNKHPFSLSPALMLTFLPHFSREEIEAAEINSEIIFMIDRSGSMQGKPIASARSTLELLLRSLSPGCAFNVLGFGTKYRLLFSEGSKRYDSDSLAEATSYASKMTADMMSTDVLSPLKHIFRMPLVPGLSRHVVLLTDGAVGNTDTVLRCVRDNCAKARLFTIGIGSSVSSELVTGVAAAGGGKAVFVREGERMQGKILKLMSDVISPCFTDVTVMEPTKCVHVFPNKLPRLFPNDRLVVYGVVAPSTSLEGVTISLSYKFRGKSYSHDLSLAHTQEEGDVSDWIHKLACSAVLSEWEQIEDKKTECVQLSCDTNLVCRHTALVGVDTGGKIVEGSMQHITLKPPQPTQLFGTQRGIYSGKSYETVCSELNLMNSGTSHSAVPAGASSQSMRTRFVLSSSPRKGCCKSPPILRSRCMSMASPINSTFDDVHSTLKSLMTLGPSHSAVPAGAPQSISNQCAAPLKRRPKCSDLESRCKSMASPIKSTLNSPMTLGPSHSAVPAVVPQIPNRCAAQLIRRPKCSGGRSNSETPLKVLNSHSNIESTLSDSSSTPSHELLISQQTAEGYWDTGETVSKILKLSEREKTMCPEGMSEREWITLLCLIALEKYTEFEDEWKLVAKKGWRWLRGCKLSINLEDVTEIARTALK